MNILFVIDRLELKYFENNKLVTNFTLIKKFLELKNDVFISTIDMLKIKNSKAYVNCYKALVDREELFYDKSTFCEKPVEEFKLVMFRPDPPFDLDYLNATYIFDFVDRSKTFIMNDTKAIRNFNEKMHAVIFNEFMPNNIVTSSKTDIMQFLKENNEIILKPLNQCFGGGVMYLKHGDKNTAVIINSMTDNGKKLIMVQQYLPSAIYGDKRVLILGEDVLPYCVQKTPSNDDFKFCEHNDDHVKKAVLTDEERIKFKTIAKKLNTMGIYMAGLDVIDGKIIEVNVTSPCYFIKEINKNFEINLENTIVDFILKKAEEHQLLKTM